MYKTLKISIASLFAVALVLAAVVMIQSAQVAAQVTAPEGEENANEGQAMEMDESKPDESSYSYQAQPGDSYSAMARKAVQTYGIDNNVNLTQAGIIFAETNLTNDADSGQLAVGQEVQISKDAVKKYVEAAEKLSEAEQKAWATYVPFVDFNTDQVGQAS